MPRVHRCSPLALSPPKSSRCKCSYGNADVSFEVVALAILVFVAIVLGKNERLVDGCRGGGLVVAGFAQRVAEPFETFVKTISGGGASRLDILRHTISTASLTR